MALYRASKAVSIALVGMGIVCSLVNGVRDAFLLHNPTGLAVNFSLIVFLIGGIMFIIRDRRTKL